MNDMRLTIIPKSDQLNADDLIAGPRTITITSVSINVGAEQPVSISFEGDDGKPYKLCKSMRRVLVVCWGPDANAYIGRSLTLYRDPTVQWGGMQVAGIRISHLSHIDKETTLALTATKQSRKPFTVKPLILPSARNSAPVVAEKKRTFRDYLRDKLAACSTLGDLRSMETEDALIAAKLIAGNGAANEIRAAFKARAEQLADETSSDDDISHIVGEEYAGA